MFAEIIPALRLPAKFSVFDYLLPDGLAPRPGDIVRVPFRSGKILGIVRKVKTMTEMTGSLKTVAELINGLNFDLETLEWASKAYGAPLPLLAFSFLPAAPKGEDDCLLPEIIPTPQAQQPTDLRILKQNAVSVFRSPNERLNIHSEIVRLAIAKGRQALILSPEEADLKFLARGLRRVAPNLVTLSGAQGIREAWKSMMAFGRGAAPLLIGTRLAAATPARNLGTIIIDREEDPSHKQSDANPRYDAREIAGRRSARGGLPLVIVSETPRLNVFYNQQDIPVPTGTPPRVINLKNEWRGGDSGLLSRPIIDALAESRQNGKLSILLHNRKGLGGLVVCRDCHETVVCGSCNRPLAAERTGLICRNCGTARDIPLFCKRCRGPRMTIKKLGIVRLAQDLKKNIRGITVAEIARRKEGAAPPPLPSADVLLGTEAMLHWYRNELFELPLGLVGIVLADSLWQKPEYLANEEALSVLVTLRNIAEKAQVPLVIQTLDPDHRALRALAENPGNFYRTELNDRERLNYPPAGILLKLTSTVRRRDDAQTKQLSSSLEKVGARTTITSLRTRRGRDLTLLVARLPDDEAIRFQAVSLAGPDWTIDVNPRNLFD